MPLKSNPVILSDSLTPFLLQGSNQGDGDMPGEFKPHQAVMFQAGENPVQGIRASKKVRLTWLAWGVQGW